MKNYEVHVTARVSYDISAGDEDQAYELAMGKFDNETFNHADINVEVERGCDPDDL